MISLDTFRGLTIFKDETSSFESVYNILIFFFLQVRDFPIKSTEDGELDDEAQWIYRQAFLEFPISQQQVRLVTVHLACMYWFGQL